MSAPCQVLFGVQFTQKNLDGKKPVDKWITTLFEGNVGLI